MTTKRIDNTWYKFLFADSVPDDFNKFFNIDTNVVIIADLADQRDLLSELKVREEYRLKFFIMRRPFPKSLTKKNREALLDEVHKSLMVRETANRRQTSKNVLFD